MIAGLVQSTGLNRSVRGGLDHQALTVLALAFSDSDSRIGKVDAIHRVIREGAYRIPARTLSACMMLEMLHPARRGRA